MDYRKLTLPQIYDEADDITRAAQASFGSLDAPQLNWKPAADSWSVAQCLEHLNATNRAYYPSFDRIRRGEQPQTLLQRMPLLPGLFGGMMIRTLGPDLKQKYKAPTAARPSASAIEPAIVEDFIAQQQETLSKMRSLGNQRPESIIITSPFAGYVVYSLLDAFRLIVAHERRHFAQAQRVLEANGFPR